MYVTSGMRGSSQKGGVAGTPYTLCICPLGGGGGGGGLEPRASLSAPGSVLS